MFKTLLIAIFLFLPNLGLANYNLTVGYGDNTNPAKDPNNTRGFSDQGMGFSNNVNGTGNSLPGGDQLASVVNFNGSQGNDTQDVVKDGTGPLSMDSRPAKVRDEDIGDDIGR